MKIQAEDWVEYIVLFLLVTGFFLALSAGSDMVSYIFVTLTGLLFARLWWRWKKNLKVILTFLMSAFIFGYTLGNIYGSRKISVLLFLLALWTGYELHKRGWMKSLEF